MKSQILIVEDDKHALLGLSEILRDENFSVETAKNAKEAFEKLENHNFHCLLTDYMLPDSDGLKIARFCQKNSPETAVIMMTAYGSVKHAVEALKQGIDNYLTKPLDLDELLIVIRRAVADKEIQKENIHLREKLNNVYRFENIVAVSGKMIDVFKKIQKVAASESTILIRGESGTGKELVARAVHYNSNRKHKDIIEINCASIPENLLESELFGHEKGSFTGAIKQKIGKFELANSGSIFLDEIGDMPLSLQAKLLRVIQERRFTRVGGNHLIEVDVRVIAATNANLEEKIAQGSFREDLYYRLNVIPIVIPPIRERREDIAPLINFFVNKIAEKHKIKKKEVKNDFYLTAERYHWPGNVRQIENAVENAIILSEHDYITAEDLPDYIRQETLSHNNRSKNELGEIEKVPVHKQIDMAEKLIIERVIRECGGNKSQAAEKLGFTLRTLRNKLNKYKLD